MAYKAVKVKVPFMLGCIPNTITIIIVASRAMGEARLTV